jgi:CheY-like chemotaxis protein
MATILMIDDDETVCMLLQLMLESYGHTVHVVLDSRDAAARLQAHSPDIVLLDTFMHPIDGLETLTALRAVPGGAEIPVIMMSGSNDPDTMARIERAGANAFVYKATILTKTVQEIVDAMKTLLGK